MKYSRTLLTVPLLAAPLMALNAADAPPVSKPIVLLLVANDLGDTSGCGDRKTDAASAQKSDVSEVRRETARQANIVSDFPGGNIVIDAIEGNDVYVHQDLRDTQGDWFYWYFAVRGAQGRELTFHFTKSRAIGLLGPGISRDGGRTWQWLNGKASANEFRYRFGPDETEVRFSFGMPYQQAELLRFLTKYKTNPCFKQEILGRTKRGTPVELLRLGCLGTAPDYRVLVTVRHHACEMMASYVTEGLIDAFLGNTETGVWLQKHVECAVIPMVDKDGVENGDQGKNRMPHDHKADYRGASIYPEVAALRAFVEQWSGGRPDITLDLHDPSINHHVIYTHALRGTDGKTAEEIAAILAKSDAMRFLQAVEEVQSGPLKFRVQDSLDFAARFAGQRPENEAEQRDRNDTHAGQKPAVPISIGFEIPYALVGDTPVTPESAQAFGRDIAAAVGAYLQTSR